MMMARLASVILVLVCDQSLAQISCSTTPPSTLTTVPPVYSNDPFLWNPSNKLRIQVGTTGTNSWSVYRASEIQQHGLWCQVRDIHTAGMSGDIGDWYYSPGSTPDGLTLAPTEGSSSVPYQSLKCANEIGIVVDGDVTNYQGLVKCTTSVPNLTRYSATFAVYTDSVYNSYSGPTVDPSMRLTLLSPRDTDSNITILLSFNVSFGPPSRIVCTYGSGSSKTVVINDRDQPGAKVMREVIRSQYINSSLPDKTCVSFQLAQPRESRSYSCAVTVEGRINIGIPSSYAHASRGSGTSNATVTVAGNPIALTASRTGYNSVLVSWTAPSLIPAGYEVFYRAVAGGNRFSGGNTSNTELILTGLTLGKTYSFFVVAFGAPGEPVLPSNPSNTVMMSFDVPRLENTLTLTPTSSSIAVLWTLPQYNPDSYVVSYSCQPFGSGSQIVADGGATSHTIATLNPDSTCTVSVTAVFGSNTSNTITSSVNTLSASTTVLAEHSTPASSKMPTVLQTSVLAFDLVTTATTLPTATLTLPPAEPTFFILTVIVPVVVCVLLVLFVAIIVIITVLAWRKRHQPSDDSWKVQSDATKQSQRSLSQKKEEIDMTMSTAYGLHGYKHNNYMTTSACAAYGVTQEPLHSDETSYEPMASPADGGEQSMPMYEPLDDFAVKQAQSTKDTMTRPAPQQGKDLLYD